MTDLPWMQIAKSYIGTKEYPGSASNPKIMEWAKKLGKLLGMNYTDDSVPWCGLFVAHCIKESGLQSIPRIPVRASAWGEWGTPLNKPSYGAILVFTRQGGGHVGFYVSEDAENYHVLGGNQSDMVCITKISKARCSAIRWSLEIPLPTSGPIVSKLSGTVSKNEA